MHLGPLFVGMALLYPWATKDYLLWNMSIGQIIMYYNMGMEAKYPDPDSDKNKLKNMSYDEVKAIRDEMRNLGLSTVEQFFLLNLSFFHSLSNVHHLLNYHSHY